MLARTAQAPAWSKQAYVCRACRRQWQVSHQRRWNGQQTQNSAASTTSDSWFDTINDISEEYSSHRPYKSAKDDSQRSPKGNSSSKAQRAKLVDSKKPKRGAMSIKSLQETLDATIPAQALGDSAGTRAMHEAKRTEFETAFLSGHSRHRDRRKDEVTFTPAGPPVTGVVQANDDILADLLHGLKADATTLAAQQDEGIDQPRKENEEQETRRREDAGPVPFPSFSEKHRSWTANKMDASASWTTDAVASEVAMKPTVWKAKTSPTDSGLGGPVVARVGGRKTLLGSYRGKAWGAPEAQASRSSRKVTFETLAKADGTSLLKKETKAPHAYRFGFVDKVKTLWRGPAKQTAVQEDQKRASPELQMESKEPDQADDMQGLLSRLVAQSETGNSTMAGTASNEIALTASDPADEGRQQAAEPNTRGEQHTTDQPVNASPELSVQLDSPEDILAKLYEGHLQPSEEKASKPTELSPDQSRQVLTMGRFTGNAKYRKVPSSGSPAIENRHDTQGAAVPSKTPNEKTLISGAHGGLEALAIDDTLSKQVQSRPENSAATEELSMEELAREHDKMSAKQTDVIDAAVSADMPSTKTAGLSLAEAMKVPMPSPERAKMSLEEAMHEAVTKEVSYIANRKQRSATARAAKEALPAKPETMEPALDMDVADQEEAEDQSQVDVLSAQLSELKIEPVDIPQPTVPYLEYGLDRVLFNPGVYQLQDAVSRVYNFDPYLQKIMPVEQFDFNALKEYKTSSQDTALAAIAKQQERRYIGSTSSMRSSLAHFHYLLSNWRKLNLDMLSHGYVGKGTKFDFTQINRAPSAIFLRWKDGSYAIDADKEFDSANVLMLLGKSMELLLTLPKDEYERYRKSDPRTVPEEQRTAPESYQYTTMGDFLMRSQLDAYDPRLPGNGTFDLKTRAVVTVRMSAHDHEKMTGYEIYGNHGRWCSYEKEYHDMARATMLKYMLQARMGRMNGIFVAYHNVKRIFGFQYIPIADMDRVLHGQSDTCLGDQEFKASLKLMNDLLNKATAKYPEQSLRIHFETQRSSDKDVPTCLHMFAEPMSEQEIDEIQDKQKEKVAEYERRIMGKEESSKPEVSPATSPESQDQASDAKASSATFAESQDEASEYARQRLRFASTDAPADEPFLNEAQEAQTADVGPLFYATAIVQSEVNGSIADERVENLRKTDEWTLNYLIKDYEVSRHHWALYDDMKARRRQALYFGREDADEADGEADGKAKVEDRFIEFLTKLSREGEAVREKQDRVDQESGSAVVVVDEPLPRVREKVETLEDYIEWMYRKEQE